MRQEADELTFAQLAERRREQRESPEQHGRREDVLAMLLEARHEDGSEMSSDELRDELLTLLVAGHETTASSLAWALQCLCHNPGVMEQLRAEVDADQDEEPYLLATIQETLRHRPVLPNVAPRFVLESITVGGFHYPSGVCLVPNGYLVHHDPACYPEPYAFRPQRFLERPPGTYTWIPFGGGRRRCLGASFALLEMKLVLRAIVRSRYPRPARDRIELPRRRNITIRPALGGRASLPPRRNGAAPSNAAPQTTPAPALAGTITAEEE
jgi:cytochrome P450